MTTTEKFQNFPPVLVRLLARHRYGRPFSGDEIAETSDLILPHVQTYSWHTHWSHIGVTDALKFMDGCGLGIDDHQAWRRTVGYLNHKPTFRYLRASPDWERFYKLLLTHWRKSLGTVTTTSNIYPPLRELAVRMAAPLQIQ